MKKFITHFLLKTFTCLLVIVLSTTSVTVLASGVNADLSALSLSSGSLSPDFRCDTTSYTAVVGSNLASILVIPTAQDQTDSLTINGNPAENGLPFEVPLSVTGCNILISVQTSSGIQKSYTIAVTRQSSPCAGLESLSLDCGSLSPVFFTSTFSYNVDATGNTAGTTITAVPADSSQTVTVNGATKSGSQFYIPLSVGDNTAVISVTATNGTTATYTVNITRASGGTFVGLSSLSLSSGALTTTFSPNTSSYTANVDGTSVYITATTADQSQTVTIGGVVAQSGVPFYQLLSAVDTPVTINVISLSGVSVSYTVDITRVSSVSSAGLSSLFISPGSLSPSFSTDTATYTSVVSGAGISIIPTVTDPSQTVVIEGKSVQSGSPYYIALSTGVNKITITVTTVAGLSKSYNLSVTCISPDSLNLLALSLNHGTLSPSFSPAMVFYTAEVDSSVNEISVATTPVDATSKVNVDGGSSTTVALNPGLNTVTVTVTAADGTTKIYTIIVKRQYVTSISVTTPDVNGVYTASVPDYVKKLDTTDTFTFTLGSDDVEIPATTLINCYGSGGLQVSLSQTPQNTFLKAYLAAPDGCTALTATDINLSGGSTTAFCSLNALVTFKLESDTLAKLKVGIPMIYYFNTSTNTFEDTGATFNLTAGTATFKAPCCGTYVIAVSLTGDSINYSVRTDLSYTINGAEKSFNVLVNRGTNSPRLEGGKIMVVTTLEGGMQTYFYGTLTDDNCTISVCVDGRATKSAVYLIIGTFDGTKIPQTYALTQFVD